MKAVDYDLGKIGYAYFDLDTGNYYISTGKDRTPWNRGHVYRNDGVDIQDNHGDPFIDNIEKGEWVQYTVVASKAGKYSVKVLAGSDNDAGKLLVEA